MLALPYRSFEIRIMGFVSTAIEDSARSLKAKKHGPSHISVSTTVEIMLIRSYYVDVDIPLSYASCLAAVLT